MKIKKYLISASWPGIKNGIMSGIFLTIVNGTACLSLTLLKGGNYSVIVYLDC